MKPIRIQLSRKKGFNLQEYSRSINGLPAVNVARPGKWGNPLKLVGNMIYINAGYRRKKPFDPWLILAIGDIDDLLNLFKAMLISASLIDIKRQKSDPDFEHWIKHFQSLDLSEIRDKNLACWCKPEDKCHAEILLKLANVI